MWTVPGQLRRFPQPAPRHDPSVSRGSRGGSVRARLPSVPIPGPYLRKLPIMPPSSHANSEQRARRRGFLISWNYQEFSRLPPVMRTQFFAAVPTWSA